MFLTQINGDMVEISFQEMQARRMLGNERVSATTLRENDPSLRRLRELKGFGFDYKNEKVGGTNERIYWLVEAPSPDYLRAIKPKWNDDTFAFLWRWRKERVPRQKTLFTKEV